MRFELLTHEVADFPHQLHVVIVELHPPHFDDVMHKNNQNIRADASSKRFIEFIDPQQFFEDKTDDLQTRMGVEYLLHGL